MNRNKNILIIGDGFIGKNLFNCYKNVYNTLNTNKNMLDITNNNSIENFFNNSSYTHVLFCAGFKDVLKCEIDEHLAYDINANAILKLSKYITNEKFIYLSTDYVFDGEKGFYNESDDVNPKTIYGKSKLLGEQHTLQSISNSIVVRTSGVYGKYCKWLEWLLNTNEKEIICFSDVFNSPTFVNNLANMIIDVAEKDYKGIINLCGPEKINRFELYSNILKYKNNCSTTLTKGTCNNTFPKDISLDTSLYQKIANKNPMSIKQGLAEFFNEN